MKKGITFGAFDLFHAGHVLMLEEAKSVCDHLTVCIQTDPSIDRKSKNSPVQSLEERQIQVLGCRYVDEVVIYDTENDLLDILDRLDWDIRILGEEYISHQKELHHNFIDFKKAFDRVWHEVLWSH